MTRLQPCSGPGESRPLRTRLLRCGSAVVLLLASGCVSPVVQNVPGAMHAAQSRARFELNCPDVQATVLSQKIVQGWRTEGSEYTIGVRGCGRQTVYVTYCLDESNCNALSQGAQVNAISNLSNLAPGLAR